MKNYEEERRQNDYLRDQLGQSIEHNKEISTAPPLLFYPNLTKMRRTTRRIVDPLLPIVKRTILG